MVFDSHTILALCRCWAVVCVFVRLLCARECFGSCTVHEPYYRYNIIHVKHFSVRIEMVWLRTLQPKQKEKHFVVVVVAAVAAKAGFHFLLLSNFFFFLSITERMGVCLRVCF